MLQPLHQARAAGPRELRSARDLPPTRRLAAGWVALSRSITAGRRGSRVRPYSPSRRSGVRSSGSASSISLVKIRSERE